MDIGLALLFGCVALIAGRTINVERIALSLIEDSKDSDVAASQILNAFLGNHDVTSDDHPLDLLQDCSKGRCEFCKKEVFEACFIATLGSNTIKVEITINGKSLFETVITVPNPPPICKDKIPFVPGVSDICLEVKDVNLKEGSGCVYISFKVKLLPSKTTLKLGCFKIPTGEDENQSTNAAVIQHLSQNQTSDVIEDGSVLKFESMKSYS